MFEYSLGVCVCLSGLLTKDVISCAVDRRSDFSGLCCHIIQEWARVDICWMGQLTAVLTLGPHLLCGPDA